MARIPGRQSAPRRTLLVACATVALGAAAAVTVPGSSPIDAAPVPTTAPAPGGPDQPAPGPVRDTPFELRGAAAVKYLEARGETAEVAANGSISPAHLVDELQHDPLMFVTSDGMVGYTEPTVPVSAATVDAAAPVAGEAVTLAQAFTLHSRPASTRVVYLDFDGHTTVDDYWNATYGVAEIVSAPYSFEGASDFSAAELQRIYDIWKVVADDYAPFNIDVTTEQPPAGGLEKSSPADTAYGKRVVISPTDWYYASQARRIGGIALIDVFSSDFDHSAFVFSNNLAGGSVKAVSEAASHEAGHTFGLYHDGRTSPVESYYAGHGDWAPIMGVGYSEPITQWSKGEYAYADNPEDDLALILQHAPAAPDDHGNTVGTATTVGTTSTTAGSLAVNDVDVFSVTVADGALTATLSPTGQNLHATVTVRNSGGQVVASGAPLVAVGWTATASATVPAGTYTMTVERAGWLTATTGFTA